MGVLDRFRVDGKRLFVTGGSRGLGREMALAIADAGADVVLVGRDVASLEKTAGDVRALGRKAWTIQGDAGIPAECERICRTALEEFGPIDILINNVGGRRVNIPTQDMPLDTWRQMLDLNLTSTFLCTKLIGGAMVTRGREGGSSTSPRSTPWCPIAGSPAATMKRPRPPSCNSPARPPPIGPPSASPSMPSSRAGS